MFEKKNKVTLENALEKNMLQEIDLALLEEPLRFCLMLPVKNHKPLTNTSLKI